MADSPLGISDWLTICRILLCGRRKRGKRRSYEEGYRRRHPILFIKLQENFRHKQLLPPWLVNFPAAVWKDVIDLPCHDWRFNLETREYEENPWFKLTKYEWKN
jgi:hypothetical protein